MTENHRLPVHNVLVYGFDKLGIRLPVEPIKTENFVIHFGTYHTQRRFQEYDGILFCQGIFESFGEARAWDGSGYLTHAWDDNMLHRRVKEVELLREKGGFICCILTSPFLLRDRGTSYETTDLSKVLTNLPHFYRKDTGRRLTHVKAVADELKRFLELYGAAWTYFENHGDTEIKTLAKVGQAAAGICIARSIYMIPSLPIEDNPDKLIEYLRLLVDGLTAIHNKTRVTLPNWVHEFQFVEEQQLADRRKELLDEVAAIDARTDVLDTCRSTLVLSDDDLVDAVAKALQLCLDVKVDTTDDLKEDIKLLQGDHVIAVGEIKGINRGVGRPNINQADSHRDRSGFPASFPCILIVNTGIKAARSLADKDQNIDGEQIKHAVNLNILILRTLDLLGLVRLVLGGTMEKSAALHLLTTSKGWLRVNEAGVQVLQQATPG